MAHEQPSDIICEACGAGLAPHLRYCLRCYRPVANENRERAHIESVRAVNTTRRTDPTIVFLPGEHEALLQRARRRKRLIVIGAISLAIIAAAAIAVNTLNHRRLTNERAGAREQMARRELNMLAEGLERFHADMGRYPTNTEGIRALTRKTAAARTDDGEGFNYWMGPYVDGVYEVDPWGNDYVYELTDGGESFALFSYGAGGEGSSSSRLQATSPRYSNF